MNHSPPAATHGGHMPTTVWWGLLALACAYIVWAVLTADRRDPNRILSPGMVARARILRVAVCLPVASAISAVLVLARYHMAPAKVVAAAVASHQSPRVTLIWEWAGLAVAIAAGLILLASVIARLRTPLPAPPPARRRATRRGRGAAAAVPPWADPGGYPPPGYPQPGGYAYPPLPARTSRRGSRR